MHARAEIRTTASAAISVSTLATSDDDATPTPPKVPPSRAERQAFDSLWDESGRAAEEEDWGTFLDKSAKALAALPEHPLSRDVRRQVAFDIGNYRVDARTDVQLRRSVEILQRYTDDLVAAYGKQASSMEEWRKVESYIGDLRARIRAPASPESSSSTPAHATPSVAEEDHAPVRGSKPLVIGGGVLTSVGGILTILGFAFYGSSYARYNDELRGRASNMDLSQAEADKAWNRIGASWAITVPGLVLLGAGIGMLVVGLRRQRRAERGRMSVGAGQVEVRF